MKRSIGFVYWQRNNQMEYFELSRVAEQSRILFVQRDRISMRLYRILKFKMGQLKRKLFRRQTERDIIAIHMNLVCQQ